MRLIILLNLIIIAITVSGYTFERRLIDGDKIIYVKGIDNFGSYSIMRNPIDSNSRVQITKSTDGRQTIIKNVYDSQMKMIDCDVELNEEEARRLADEIDTEIEIYTKNHFPNPDTSLSRMGRPASDLQMDLDVQATRCENFLQKIAQENHQSEATPVEIMENDDEQISKRRQKRGYLIWPGTNWCGKGSKAEFSTSYGENVATDQCCQKHDQCPYIIEGFTTKYNLFNYRMHTLSVCDCDAQFMDCLKSANTSTATMVGKVFFNVVNTECFDLKLQKSCSKRSWWGGCEKYTTKWTAAVRTLGNFPELIQ